MAYVEYRAIRFRPATLALIGQADTLCREYAAAGYTFTLRQLFYRLVAAGVLPNRQAEYKRLGSIVDDAWYAGMIDWDHIVDRTREYRSLPPWGSVHQEGEQSALDFVRNVMPEFRISRWDNQPTRVEVWVEKEALLDVIARPARALDVGWFACRGYNSSSNAHEAARRVGEYFDGGAQRVVVLHLGDHDSSGIDMSRDIHARFRTFLKGDGYDPDALEVRRIALNMDQVRQYQPSPNTAKQRDSRHAEYVRRFGTTSWELDALDPPTLDALIREHVLGERDDDLWADATAKEDAGKDLLQRVAGRWADVVNLMAES